MSSTPRQSERPSSEPNAPRAGSSGSASSPPDSEGTDAALLEAAGRHKYLQIRDLLGTLVRQLPPGAALPTERELCERFSVSRSTVRQALARLEAEQRVFRRQGSGTYVAEPKIEQSLELAGHTEYMREKGLQPASRLIECTRGVPDPEVATMLGLPESGDALKIQRVRLVDAEPLAIETVFLDAERFPDAGTALDEGESLYRLLHQRYGVDLISAEETIEVILADDSEARLLDVFPGAPLLKLSRRSRDAHGVPIEFVRSLYRGDRFRFRTELERFALASADIADVQLRDGTPEDADALAAIFVAAWRVTYPGIVADAILGELDEADVARKVHDLLAAGGSATTVAETPSHEVLGFCRYGSDPENARRGHVFSLFVAPAGGRELGRMLLAHAVETLQQRGLDPITLWVFEGNEAALRLYAPFGFSPDGGRKVEPEFAADAIRLRRDTRKVRLD